MNKKIIFFIVIFSSVIIGSYFITTSILKQSSVLGLIAIERVEFLDDGNYIKVDNQFLNEFQLQDGFINADTYTPFELTVEKIHSDLVHTIVEMDGHMIKKIEKSLIESNSGISTIDHSYYLKYDEKFYWVGIFLCDPQCPHFVEAQLLG